MSLNLRINRPRPRNRVRGNIIWLFIVIILSLGWLAWLQGWQPEQILTHFSANSIMPYVPPVVAQSLPQAVEQQLAAAQAESAPVIIVTSEVIENPESDAFTADLYNATGKDTIPWPNIDGRTKIFNYTVQSGDSLWGIANQFGLDIDTLRWSNPELESNPDVLAVDQKLHILPVQGVYHTAEEGDTIDSIAVLYGVAPEDITGYPPNALFAPYQLEKGQGVIVPFGQKGRKLSQPALAWDSPLAWPIAGTVSGTFDATHEAMDIGAPYGSTVYAADSGTITYSGWAYDGYGYSVVIDHGNGRETWYNHLKGALLEAGSFVERGTPIGEVGSTGHSTAPHVHFELRLNGTRVDPMPYLPGDTPQ